MEIEALEEEESESAEEEELKGEVLFDPQDLIENFMTQEDLLMVKTDQPERLQMRYKRVPDSNELVEETNWLSYALI